MSKKSKKSKNVWKSEVSAEQSGDNSPGVKITGMNVTEFKLISGKALDDLVRYWDDYNASRAEAARALLNDDPAPVGRRFNLV